MANKFFTESSLHDPSGQLGKLVAAAVQSVTVNCNQRRIVYENLRKLLATPPAGFTTTDVVKASGMTADQLQQILAVEKGSMIALAGIVGDTITFTTDDAVAPASVPFTPPPAPRPAGDASLLPKPTA